MRPFIVPLLMCPLLLLLACTSPNTPSNSNPNPNDASRKLLFLSHTFQYGTRGNKIDYRLESLNRSNYDELWLGGDLCSETTLEKPTLSYLDSLFDLKSENTHWTVGNHDLRNGHPEWIEATTEKPSFYSHTSFGLTRLVLNTCLLNPQLPAIETDAEDAATQWDLITSVTDTIQESSHLILLMHHMVFGAIDFEMNSAGGANSDQPFYSFRDDSLTTFADSLYPRLVEVQKRGVQVLVLSGDLGQKAKYFYWPTDEGIKFFGCGINNSVTSIDLPGYVSTTEPDRALLLYHDVEQKRLSWRFPTLNSLLMED